MSNTGALVYFVVSCVATVLLSSTCDAYPEQGITSNHFPQLVDHFNNQNHATFSQRYWVNSAFFDDKEPRILLYLNSFAFNPQQDLTNGTIGYWAKHLSALAIELEPRYFGDSYPVPSLNTTDLSYQSVEQNIADIAYFVSQYNEKLLNIANDKVQWILIGSLFDGAYATWSRSKYPELITGSVGLSSPLLATLSYTGYDAVLQRYLGASCSRILSNLTLTLENEFATASPSTFNKTQFKLNCGCNQAPLLQDDTEFFYVVAQLVLGAVQYGSDQFCANLTSMSREPISVQLTNYAALIRSLLVSSGTTCADWDIALDTKTNIGGKYSDFRPTYYLQCTQLGQFDTPDSTLPLRATTLTSSWYLSVCATLFGEAVVPRDGPDVESFNSANGGTAPPGTNMLFVVGEYDPYSGLSPAADVSPTQTVWFVQCSNPEITFSVLAPPTTSDPHCLSQTRTHIQNTIEGWVSLKRSHSSTKDAGLPEAEHFGVVVGVVSVACFVGGVVATFAGIFVYKKLTLAARQGYLSIAS